MRERKYNYMKYAGLKGIQMEKEKLQIIMEQLQCQANFHCFLSNGEIIFCEEITRRDESVLTIHGRIELLLPDEKIKISLDVPITCQEKVKNSYQWFIQHRNREFQDRKNWIQYEEKPCRLVGLVSTGQIYRLGWVHIFQELHQVFIEDEVFFADLKKGNVPWAIQKKIQKEYDLCRVEWRNT